MHHELIKAEIRMRNTTPSLIAAELQLSRTTVTQVIRGTGRSARVESYISELIEKPVEEIWPNREKPIPKVPRKNNRSVLKIAAKV